MPGRASPPSFGDAGRHRVRAGCERAVDRRSHMAVVVDAQADRAAAGSRPEAADAFVAFGITGAVAKVMTFSSLYCLERRGLLRCPILGVSVDDWSVDQLREHART